MSADQDIENLLRKQLIQEEVQRMKNKLRPIVRLELESYTKDEDFKKKLSEVIRSQLIDILCDDWGEFITPKNWKLLMKRAVKSVIK